MKNMDLVLVFACRYPVFPATFVEEAVSSTAYVLGVFVKNQVTVAEWIHIWVFSSVGLYVCFCASIVLFFLLIRIVV
jgi:hypothetical protein